MTSTQTEMSEAETLLLIEMRIMEGNILDNFSFNSFDSRNDHLVTKVKANVLRRVVAESTIKFQEQAVYLAINAGDAALMTKVLPRLRLQYDISHSLVSHACRQHDVAYYFEIREFWKSLGYVAPKSEEDLNNDELREFYYGKKFANPMDVIFHHGTSEVFDLAIQEFNDYSHVDQMVKGANWELIQHVVSQYQMPTDAVTKLANCLREKGGHDDLVDLTLKNGFTPDINRDPFDNILDLISDDDFYKAVMMKEKLKVIKAEAAKRLVWAGMFGRIEQILQNLTKPTNSAFYPGIGYTLQYLAKSKEYDKITAVCNILKSWEGSDNDHYYAIQYFFEAAIGEGDIEPLRRFYKSGLTFDGEPHVCSLPTEKTLAVLLYLNDHATDRVMRAVIGSYLNFSYSDIEETRSVREAFYFKMVEAGLITQNIAGHVMWDCSYRRIPDSVVDDIICNDRRKEEEKGHIYYTLNSSWAQYLTGKSMLHLIQKESSIPQQIWQESVKRFIGNNQIEVIRVLMDHGYQPDPIVRGYATRMGRKEIRELLYSKDVKKGRKAAVPA
jgi:hypothetical protein